MIDEDVFWLIKYLLVVDGDVLNINSLKIDSVKDEYYEKLNPMNNIFISHDDGKYNIDGSLLKYQSIGLYCFANI